MDTPYEEPSILVPNTQNHSALVHSVHTSSVEEPSLLEQFNLVVDGVTLDISQIGPELKKMPRRKQLVHKGNASIAYLILL